MYFFSVEWGKGRGLNWVSYLPTRKNENLAFWTQIESFIFWNGQNSKKKKREREREGGGEAGWMKKLNTNSKFCLNPLAVLKMKSLYIQETSGPKFRGGSNFTKCDFRYSSQWWNSVISIGKKILYIEAQAFLWFKHNCRLVWLSHVINWFNLVGKGSFCKYLQIRSCILSKSYNSADNTINNIWIYNRENRKLHYSME